MQHAAQTSRDWQRVPLSHWQWNAQDPNDPDLELLFRLPEGVQVRVNSAFPLRWAQRLANKNPSLVLTRQPEGVELSVTVGLSLLHRLPASPRDRLLSVVLPQAVQVHIRRLETPVTGIHLEAPSPLQFSLPT